MGGDQLIIVIPLLVPVVLAIGLLVYLARRRGSFDAILAMIVATGGIWCGGYLLEFLAMDFDSALRAVKLQYVAFVMGPIAWVLLGLKMQDRTPLLSPRLLALLLFVPVITLSLVFTSEYHTLFWRSKELVAFHGYSVFESTYGPGFWLHCAFSYAMNLVGAVLVIAAMFESGRYYLRQRVALMMALGMPWIANVFYIFRVWDIPLDLTPFTLLASGLVMVFGVFGLGLGDLVPIARARVLANMKDGVIVLDSKMRIVDFNGAAKLLFGLPDLEVGRHAEALFLDHPKLLRLLQRQRENTDLVYTIADRVQMISSEILDEEHGSRLLMIRDLSSDGRIQDALRVVVEGTSQDVGEEFYHSVTRSLAAALNTRYAVLGIMDEAGGHRVRTLAFWDSGRYRDNVVYDLAGSPCESAIDRGTCTYPDGVARLFPDDSMLVEMNVVGYLGTRLFDHAGNTLGILNVMDDKPLENVELGRSLLEILANRAAAEIEREINERRLAASEQSYRRIVETTEDGVCVTDAEGMIEFVNDRMATMIGDGRDDVLGQRLLGLMAEEPGPDGEIRVRNTVGREYWVNIARTHIRDDAGRTSGILHLYRDVTEERHLAEINREIEHHLQHAQKMESLGVLAGGVAHDFNNLLMPILGYLDLIKQRSAGDPVIADYIGRIQNAGGNLADLCNQMLTYSGKGHFVESQFSMNTRITEMQELIRASVPRSIELDFDLEEDIHQILADATQVNQVLMNLVLNAAESMSDKREGRVCIRTGEEYLDRDALATMHVGDDPEPGRFVYVEVEDQGVGLGPEESNRLFEPFYTTKFTGRGLGMAVVYGIVRAHNGAARVDSKLGEGTRMRVYLPAVESKVVAAAPVGRAEDTSSGANGRILVVDDEDYVRELVRNMLESIGFEVVEASSGGEGLRTFRAQHGQLDACVIDMTMPGMGGVELLKQIRETDGSVPILLVSGYSQQEVRDRRIHSDNVRFLQKPFTVEQMRLAMQFDPRGSTITH
jgi:PAS domain S-box-containing protein